MIPKCYRTNTRLFPLAALLLAGAGSSCAWLRPAAPAPAEGAPGGAAEAVPALEIQAAAEENPSPRRPALSEEAEIRAWCADVGAQAKVMGWDLDPCSGDFGRHWRIGGRSVEGRPLVYAEFGRPEAENTTLFLAMVHGDEGTPLYVGLRLAQWLAVNESRFPATRVVVAPLVNPDGFFNRPRTRVNARGVDVNRNFMTKDWEDTALSSWKKQFRSNPRRFPGSVPGSEPETLFQAQLIGSYSPQKIISVHAPLNFMDYDGPTTLSLEQFPEEYVRKCLELRSELNAVSGGYYPGSLGNYAGRERGIPTFTLELPTANPKLAGLYWNRFRTGIQTVIVFKVPQYADSKSGRVTAGYP